MTCAGRLVRAAISVIEMELVLLARTASGPASRSRSPKILNFEIPLLGDGLDDERRTRDGVHRGGRLDTPQNRVLVGALQRPFLDLPVQVGRLWSHARGPTRPRKYRSS